MSWFFSYGLSCYCIHRKNMATYQVTQAACACLLLIVQRDPVTKLKNWRAKNITGLCKKVKVAYEKIKLNCEKKN